jgi:hypothetical protein
MSERLSQYYSKKARRELRGDLAYPLMAFGISAIVFVGYGLAQIGSVAGLAFVVAGTVLGFVAYGMYRCHGWVRWPAVLLLAIGCGLAAWHALTDGASISTVVQVAGCGFGAIYLALPSTAELFVSARGE